MPPDLKPWQTDAAGPFVTIHAGGPLEGIVTLTAIAEGHGRTLVEAVWTQGAISHSASVEVASYEEFLHLGMMRVLHAYKFHIEVVFPREVTDTFGVVVGHQKVTR